MTTVDLDDLFAPFEGRDTKPRPTSASLRDTYRKACLATDPAEDDGTSFSTDDCED